MKKTPRTTIYGDISKQLPTTIRTFYLTKKKLRHCRQRSKIADKDQKIAERDEKLAASSAKYISTMLCSQDSWCLK